MKAVNVFGRINGFEDALGVDLGRQGKLHEDAIDIVVMVEVVDDAEHVESRGVSGRSDEAAGEAEEFASGDFAFDVELRSGIVAGEDGGKSRTNAGGGQHADFVLELFEDLVADFVAVEDSGGHRRSLSVGKGNHNMAN